MEMPGYSTSRTKSKTFKNENIHSNKVGTNCYSNKSLKTTLCECDVCNLVEKGFSSFNAEGKKQIILKGRPTPTLTNLTQQSKLYVRRFQRDNYKKCKWLTGCDTKSLLFCWPCLLFSKVKNLWNKSGFSDLNNLHSLIKKHSISKAHIDSIIKEKFFCKTKIERALEEQLKANNEKHNQEVHKNREILRRVIDVMCFLNQHELEFWGRSESKNSTDNKGNYVDLINLLAKYDATLKFYLVNSTVFKYIDTQNSLISCIVEVVMTRIKNEIKESSFIALILDETIYDGNISLLSKVVRYATRKGDIREYFLGYLSPSLSLSKQRTATALYRVVDSVVKELNCASKLVALSCNGLIVMPGELEKLQAKVRESYPSALFVDCIAYPLNLGLQQSLSSIKACKLFFSTISDVALFFSKSSRRTSALESEVHKEIPEAISCKWKCNSKLAQTVFEYHQPLIDFFENILDNPNEWDHETVVFSRGYLEILKTDANFILLLLIFSEIFLVCDDVSAVLQNKASNIDFCSKKLQEFESFVSSKREHFDLMWNKTEQLMAQIHPSMKVTYTDIVGNEKDYSRGLFSEIIDNICTHTNTSVKNCTNLKFLELINFNDHCKIPQSVFNSLKENYSQYFNFPALRSEFSVIYNTSEGINKSSVSDLWKSIKECELDQACPEILKVCELILTIPSISASTEFSALKRIKNFNGNCTGPERPTQMALLSIENELIEEMALEQKFYDDIVDEFAKRNGSIPLNFHLDKNHRLTPAERLIAYRHRRRQKNARQTASPDSSTINKKPALTSAERVRAYRQRQREKRLEGNSSVDGSQENRESKDFEPFNNKSITTSDSSTLNKKRKLTSTEKVREHRQRQRGKRMKANSTILEVSHDGYEDDNSEQSSNEPTESADSSTMRKIKEEKEQPRQPGDINEEENLFDLGHVKEEGYLYDEEEYIEEDDPCAQAPFSVNQELIEMGDIKEENLCVNPEDIKSEDNLSVHSEQVEDEDNLCDQLVNSVKQEVKIEYPEW